MKNGNQKTMGRQPLNAEKLIQQVERLAGLGFWEWDVVADCLTSCSEGYARMLDMTREEMIAASNSSAGDYHFVHPDDLQRYIDAEKQASESGRGVDIEYRAITASGRERHFHEIAEVVKDDSGEVIRTSGIVQDITESKRVQDELAISLADARKAERLAKLGTYTWIWKQGEGQIETCSEEYARLLEMTVEQVLQSYTSVSADRAAIHPDDRDVFAALEAEALARGEGYTANYRLLLSSGCMRHIHEICEVELDSQGQVIRSMGSIQDITEQVQLQEQLNQAVKIKALGQLTGGVAHDFNNILTLIMGNVDLTLAKLGQNSPSADLLLEVLRAVERGATLTKRLLAFSRKQPLNMQAVDLQNLVLSMGELLQRTLGETIQVEIQQTDVKLVSDTDPTQLESAILNLAINARDAMPNGGCLRIKLDTVHLDEDFVASHGILSPGSYNRITVSDTGVGMPPEIQAQVFDPFYTTKGIGEGTGLGLSIVYGFLKQCHGHVNLYSEPGKGTVVKLYLPSHPQHNIKKPAKSITEYSRGNGERILVVEDDADVRKLALLMLQDLGYRTIEAENAEEGLRLLRTEPSIALLFSDVVLPGGMSGVNLAEEAWRSDPELKVFFVSGYTRESSKRFEEMGYQLLEKPYTKIQLAHMLSKVLGKPVPVTEEKLLPACQY